MHLITEQFGKCILVVVVSAFIFLIVFNVKSKDGSVGVPKILEDHVDIPETDYVNRVDGSTSTEKSNRQAPSFKVERQNTFKTNQEIKLSDYIKTYDQDNVALKLEILSIKYQDGTELIDSFKDGKITFKRSGMYTIGVSSMDSERLRATRNINITINRG